MATDNIARAMATKALNEGGGGEGGTSDYAVLSHKPSINGEELLGNKTAEDLKLATAEELVTLKTTVDEIEEDVDNLNDALRNGFSILNGDYIPLEGKNITDLRNILTNYATKVSNNKAGIVVVRVNGDWITKWNNGDLITPIESGYSWTFTLLSTTASNSLSHAWIVSSFSDDTLYVLNKANDKWSNVKKIALEKNVLSIFDTPINHNGIYRGKNLTSIYTVDELYTKVSKGDFSDLYLGDYITVSISTLVYFDNGDSAHEDTVTESVDLMIAAFDYYLNCGDKPLTKHHLVLIPRVPFETKTEFNTLETTKDGYLNSHLNREVLPEYAASLKAVLNDHLITYRDRLTNAVTTTAASMAGAGLMGAASGWAWTDVTLQLMNEVQLYGTTIWSSSAYDVGVANRQFPIFRFIAPAQEKSSKYWLRSVVSERHFAYFNTDGGHASYDPATYKFYLRPFMLFG